MSARTAPRAPVPPGQIAEQPVRRFASWQQPLWQVGVEARPDVFVRSARTRSEVDVVLDLLGQEVAVLAWQPQQTARDVQREGTGEVSDQIDRPALPRHLGGSLPGTVGDPPTGHGLLAGPEVPHHLIPQPALGERAHAADGDGREGSGVPLGADWSAVLLRLNLVSFRTALTNS